LHSVVINGNKSESQSLSLPVSQIISLFLIPPPQEAEHSFQVSKTFHFAKTNKIGIKIKLFEDLTSKSNEKENVGFA